MVETKHGGSEFESDFACIVSDLDPISTRNRLDGSDLKKNKYIEGSEPVSIIVPLTVSNHICIYLLT